MAIPHKGQRTALQLRSSWPKTMQQLRGLQLAPLQGPRGDRYSYAAAGPRLCNSAEAPQWPQGGQSRAHSKSSAIRRTWLHERAECTSQYYLLDGRITLCNQHSNVPSLRPCHVEQHHQEGYLLITRATRKQFAQVSPDATPLVLLGLKRSPVRGALFEEQTQRKPSGKCCLLQQRSHVYAS